MLHRAEPDYYDTVTTPMDMTMIQQKLKNEEYDDVEQMSTDIQLIVSNAKAVYGVSSTDSCPVLFCNTLGSLGWLSSQVVSVLDSGTEGPGFKSQSRHCRVTVLGKLFTPIVPLFTKQQNWSQPS